MIVVKVGGSLFDHPALGPGLREYLESLAPAEVLLVPGGGPVADAVRELDRTHGLGEEASHWLALRALGVTADLLRRLLGEGRPTPQPPPCREGVNSRKASSPSEVAQEAIPKFTPFPSGRGAGGGGFLDCFTFALEDESRPGALPHTWNVTTDSIAARVAFVYRAERLILLKSVDIPHGTPWGRAAANGWVDPYFPQVAPTLVCPIEAVNFRRRLDARA